MKKNLLLSSILAAFSLTGFSVSAQVQPLNADQLSQLSAYYQMLAEKEKTKGNEVVQQQNTTIVNTKVTENVFVQTAPANTSSGHSFVSSNKAATATPAAVNVNSQSAPVGKTIHVDMTDSGSRSTLLTPEMKAKIANAKSNGELSSNVNVTVSDSAVINETFGTKYLKFDNQNNKSNLVVLGSKDKDYPALTGYANDLPLADVLNQLIPVGWKATAVDNADVDVKVSWNGGQPWDVTFTQIVKTYNLNASLDWNKKLIRILPSVEPVAEVKSTITVTESVVEPKKSVIEFGAAEKNPVVKKTAKEKVSDKDSSIVVKEEIVVKETVTAAPSNKILEPLARSWDTPHHWVIKNGDLKSNLEKWASIVNFKLVYPDNVANYPIDDDGFDIGYKSLGGENGAVASLAILFTEGRVRQPLDFDLKTGGNVPVLIVSNKTYQQKFFKEEKEKQLMENSVSDADVKKYFN